VGGKGAFFGMGSMSIRSTVIAGQTEGLKVGCGGVDAYICIGLFLLHNKGKNYAVFCFAGKRKFIYLYL
jgi:hypothetical protein